MAGEMTRRKREIARRKRKRADRPVNAEELACLHGIGMGTTMSEEGNVLLLPSPIRSDQIQGDVREKHLDHVQIQDHWRKTDNQKPYKSVNSSDLADLLLPLPAQPQPHRDLPVLASREEFNLQMDAPISPRLIDRGRSQLLKYRKIKLDRRIVSLQTINKDHQRSSQRRISSDRRSRVCGMAVRGMQHSQNPLQQHRIRSPVLLLHPHHSTLARSTPQEPVRANPNPEYTLQTKSTPSSQPKRKARNVQPTRISFPPLPYSPHLPPLPLRQYIPRRRTRRPVSIMQPMLRLRLLPNLSKSHRLLFRARSPKRI